MKKHSCFILFLLLSPVLLPAATVSVDTARVLRTVSPQAFAVNFTEDHFNNFSPASLKLWNQIGTRVYRWPGGSDADAYDFLMPTPKGHHSTADFARLAEAQHADAYITLNYGSGSPQMAAAFAAYLNASVGDPTVLGTGKRVKDPGHTWEAAHDWVDYDWKTAGYWAALRASTPLAKDDGWNHMRAGHPRPWGFKYFEIGNECFGSWEKDIRPVGQRQSPLHYSQFAADTAALIKKFDPGAKFGIVVMPREDVKWANAASAKIQPILSPASGRQVKGWTAALFFYASRMGFVPDFVIDHHYCQNAGDESDAKLLAMLSPPSTASDDKQPLSWEGRAGAYRGLLNAYFGGAAGRIEIINTEHNSVSSNPGKQTTSLVNGLFYADSFGGILRTEIKGFCWWSARGGSVAGSNAAKLFGWRLYGDYGLLGDKDDGSPNHPGRDVYTPYPAFFGAQLAAIFAHEGDQVLDVASDDPLLAAYACGKQDRSLALLVINKSPDQDKSVSFSITGFTPSPKATQFQYGKTQDAAQAKGAAVHLAASWINNAGPRFSVVFPAYSMSVIVLSPK